MPFPYKTALVLGATSGIGLDLAEKFIANGVFVIAVGRRQSNLDEIVKKHGSSKVASYAFDITNLGEIESFAETVTKAHPTLDTIILNSGIQRSLDFANPASISLPTVDAELTTNYLAPIHLVTAFLPFLAVQKVPTSLIFVTSGLALVPLVRCGNYCASKAALHHLILTMREQLRSGNVKVIEIMPPAVQTELHDEKHQPDIKNGAAIGMPLAEFTEQAWKGLQEGLEVIPVGMSKVHADSWEQERLKAFHQFIAFLAKSGGH